MQETSEKYKRILAGSDYWFETSVVIGTSGRLVTKTGEVITFGGDAILVDTGGADGGYREDQIFSIRTSQEFFKNGKPEAGSAIAAEIDLVMIAPFNVPKQARISPYIRACNETETSEWIPQGIYYIDTRETTHDDRGYDILTVHGYDAMILAENDYPSDREHDYPLVDIEMVQFIAENMKPDTESKSGISVDPRTVEIMNQGYMFPLPVGYSKREVLAMIAAAYGGNFIISPIGELRLVRMFDIPDETRYLITEDGYAIVFGEDRILV